MMYDVYIYIYMYVCIYIYIYYNVRDGTLACPRRGDGQRAADARAISNTAQHRTK